MWTRYCAIRLENYDDYFCFWCGVPQDEKLIYPPGPIGEENLTEKIASWLWPRLRNPATILSKS
jgi:hypothetical protein